MLYEDGRMLGLAHSMHDHISRFGKGRFSHYGPNLYFSASDNSDPNQNGRTYAYCEQFWSCEMPLGGDDDLAPALQVAIRGPSRCGMMQPCTPRNPRLSDALQAYETCGFDTAAIRQWCIPELDAEMLVDATLRQRPKRILEVGTYVGVSTLLLALATDADFTIVTIDPNLPLGTEMGSMESGSWRPGRHRAHPDDVARAAARQLGVDLNASTSSRAGLRSGTLSRRADRIRRRKLPWSDRRPAPHSAPSISSSSTAFITPRLWKRTFCWPQQP